MKPPAFERAGWSRQRLAYTGAAVFLAQIGLIWLLSQRVQSSPPRPEFRTTISLALNGPSLERLEKTTLLNDPALLALPSLNGFSGLAWLKFKLLDYQPSEYNEPPRWLGLDGRSLGGAFSNFVQANDLFSPVNADRPLPLLQRYEPNYASAAVPAESRLRIEGDLSSRPLRSRPELKSWPHSEILSNTVVQAVVDADGYVITARLLRDSGLPEADQHALNLAQAARWQPLRISDGAASVFEQLTWGRLVFQWHTLTAVPTNHTSSEP